MLRISSQQCSGSTFTLPVEQPRVPCRSLAFNMKSDTTKVGIIAVDKSGMINYLNTNYQGSGGERAS